MPRIEDYAMIGDCETAAPVARNGSIDRLCFPATFARQLSAGVFARRLDQHGEESCGRRRSGRASAVHRGTGERNVAIQTAQRKEARAQEIRIGNFWGVLFWLGGCEAALQEQSAGLLFGF